MTVSFRAGVPFLRLPMVCAVLAVTWGAGCNSDPERASAASPDGGGPGEWVTYGRTASEQRFSPLTQVDEKTVSRLGLAWSFDLGTLRALEATPLVKDGVMYVTSAWSLLYALNAKTGELLWTYDPHVPKDHSKYVCCDVVNRGVAFYNGRVYFGTLDGRLLAVDAKTGARVWEVKTTPDGPYAITGAPRIATGKVIIGNAGSEYVVRGYVSAYDAESGALAWRVYTVPGDPSKPFESEAMRKAAATWSGEWWKLGGGGSAWDPIVYDADLDLVIFGTGNGAPWYPEHRGPDVGDNLYTSSIVAVRAGTGEYVWHFQTTPGDSWDYDATQPLLLADLAIDGRSRKVVMQANKNGFFYVIDRENGQFISGRQFTTVTWASGLDPKGRPIEDQAARAQKEPAIVRPSPEGGHNWHPISFNPSTGLVYLAVLDDPFMHAIDRQNKLNPHDQTLGIDAHYAGPQIAKWLAMKTTGRLVAWDPVNQREAWHVELPQPKSGGTLTTAGNLVFQGRADGTFSAYRATSGDALWSFDGNVGIAAAPMTYEIDGTQYVAVLAGWGGPMVLLNAPAGAGKVGFGRLLVFALDRKETLPKYERTVAPVPMPEMRLVASRQDVAEGGALFNTYCARCHGFIAISGGSVPDLRYAETYIHHTFQDIVRGGARRQFGMPSFAEDLTDAQVRQIQAYVLQRARESVAPAVTH